ncbi:REJ domain protein, partial (macronuclear) [Tetrahymena thermophila SB210]
MKTQKIRIGLFFILQILKYLYAGQNQDCGGFLTSTGSFNLNFSQCLFNYINPALQSDIDSLKNYFLDTNCLNSSLFPQDQTSYLSGNSCTLDNQIIIKYTSQNPATKIYSIGFSFKFKAIIPYQPTTLYSIIEINNMQYNSLSTQQTVNSDNYYTSLHFLFQDKQNVDSITIKLTPLNVNLGQTYQIYFTEINLAVQFCQINCDKCDYNQICLQCSSGFYYQQAINQCVSSCNSNQFVNQQQQCQLCDNNCASCDGPSSNNCLSCNPGSYIDTIQKICTCHSTCKTCDGLSSNNCLSCYPGIYYNPNTKSCNCDSTCKTCDGPSSNNCLSCYPGIYYNPQAKSCTCDSTCKTCDGPSSNNCLSCNPGIYYNPQAKSCKCDSTCKTCDGPSSNNCLSCNPGIYYSPQTKSCSCDSTCKTCDGLSSNNCLSCNPGIYYNPLTKSCSCDSTCKTCDGPSSNNCLSCNPGIYYNPQTKSCSCDSTCKTCDGPSSNNCLSCNSGLYIDTIQKICTCHSTCKTCDGLSSNNCLSCNPGLYYQQATKQCVQSCNQNQYPNQISQLCQSCDISCASCDGKDSNNCLSCYPNSFLYNKSCVSLCPNGFQSNNIQLTCDSCQNYLSLQCNACYPTCQLCDQSSILNQQCKTCYNETRQLDVLSNTCVCKNQNDKRNIFYQCSYQNIAVLDAKLSATSPQLSIDFGSPLINIISNTPQSLCSQIFDQATLATIGLDSQCQISGNQILVNLSDSSTIMENNQITLLPNKLQFVDYSGYFINTFYRNIIFQEPPGIPQLQFSYNHIENSCNPINITLYGLQNDAGRKFMSFNWTLNQIVGSISNDQQENIKQILLEASQNKNTSLIIDPKFIPPNINIAISLNYLLKVNQAGTQTFTIAYQKQKFIRITYQQSVYPPIYRYMSLSFYFQFYIQICELGQMTYINNEPIDLQLVSNQLQKQNLNQYNQMSFQYDILPYTLASNQKFDMSLILNLSSDSNVVAIQKISVNIQITDLYLQIIGGSSLVQGYTNKMVLNTDSRDYELQDPNSPSNINLSWQCYSLSSQDHICYDQQNNQIQLQQGASSITFPAKTFQPYTAVQFTVVGQKDSRQKKYTTTCIFTELDVPPLNILSAASHINQKINLNDDLNFQILYGENVSSDYLSYAGAILYNSDPVAAIKFDYFQIRFRIWDYFQNINPSNPTLQIRFSVYNPLFVMPSLSTISIQINIPPQNCVLNVSPSQGIALETIFQIQFLNCKDEDLPLTYQFFYYNSADDANQELVSPWNILRRQIQDQTINNSIQTVLPRGNLVVMAQAMDSYLGVYNTSSIIMVQAQKKTADEYYQLVNQLTSQALQSSNNQVNNQLVTLSIIAEDISKSNQLSQQLNDFASIMIQNIQQLSLQIPKFSLLSTFANKVTAQLSYLIFSSSQQNNFAKQKNNIFGQVQTILQNTNSSIQSSNLSHLQQNNDIHIQNIVDSFKILNSSVTLSSMNSQEDFQSYDKISSQIGNLLSNISLPNQGQIILNGDLSNLLSDKITQKNLYKYAL